MKKRYAVFIAIILTGILGFLVVRRWVPDPVTKDATYSVPAKIASETPTTGVVGITVIKASLLDPPRGLRPEWVARWRELETLGRVPEDAKPSDWALAEHTSWWGKPLDATNFWRGRVIWCDETARREAARHGRMLPPVPPGDYSLPLSKSPRSNKKQYDIQDPTPTYHYSSEERRFWEYWRRTTPPPPEMIAESQRQVAEYYLGGKKEIANGPNVARRTEESMQRGLTSQVKREIEMGFPPEAYDEQALYWALARGMREQQLRDEQNGHVTVGVLSPIVQTRLAIPAEYATRDLTPEETAKADAWRIAYLRRLKTQKTDQSYIDAYLKAWNLDPKEVFPE